MVTYSYKSFSKDDIKDINIWSNEELNKFDYIKISPLSNIRKRSQFSHYHTMAIDVLNNTGNFVPAVFKNIAVKDDIMISNNKYNDTPITFTYCLSDRNDDKNRDDERVLECGLYSYKNDEYGHFMMTFKIKLEHILTAIDNFKNNIRYIKEHLIDESDSVLSTEENNKLINTYVIPIYIFTKRHRDSKPKYVRFSDHVKNDNALYVLTLLEFINYSLERYVYVNTLAWYTLNHSTSYKISTDTKTIFGTKKSVNRENLANIARKNKHIVVELDKAHNIPLVINTTRKNMYYGTSTKACSLSSYKFQVIGHYQHYWVGKGRKTRIKYWIDPYFKNKDKEFNVVKEYKKE
jgi:hypothetical protein